MKRGDYFNTRRGQASRYFWRHLRRFRFGFDAGMLRTKDSASKQENLRFQERLIEEMVQHKRRMFRGNVVLEMDFTIAQDNPPIIHKLPKYYIDLLENPLPELNSKCRKLLKNGNKLLLENDRQVKLLIVNYYVNSIPYESKSTTTGKGKGGYPSKIRDSSVSFTIDRMSNFYEDLHLLQRIRSDNFIDDDRHAFRRRQFELEEDDDDLYEEERYDEAIRDFKKMLTEKDSYLESYSKENYEFLLQISRRYAQEYFLKRRSVTLAQWEEVFSSVLNKKRPVLFRELMKSLNDDRGFVFSNFFSIELPGTPHKDGESENFKTKTKQALKEYYDRNVILKPLSHPISVTIFLVPPNVGGKDLDNLALKIIPIIHDVLNPPTFEKVFSMGAAVVKSSHPGKKRVFNGVHQSMVSSYQVVELPRIDSDPEGGSVRVVFGDGLQMYENVWKRSTEILEKWEEFVQRV